MVGKNAMAVFRLSSFLEKKKLAPSTFIPAANSATVFAIVDFPMPATPSRTYIGARSGSSPAIQLAISFNSLTRVPFKHDTFSETSNESYAACGATLRFPRFWFYAVSVGERKGACKVLTMACCSRRVKVFFIESSFWMYFRMSCTMIFPAMWFWTWYKVINPSCLWRMGRSSFTQNRWSNFWMLIVTCIIGFSCRAEAWNIVFSPLKRV